MFRCFKRCFLKRCCKEKEENIFPQVYVLQLENEKFYVGKSLQKERRIQNHFLGNGSAWTRKYNPISVLEPLTKPQESFWELWETLELMKQYGIDNVRGSMFTSPFNLSEGDKIMAANLYCELHDLCRKCGGEGHFITYCKNDTTVDWVHNFGGVLNTNKKVNVERMCMECGINISTSPNNFRYCRKCFYDNNKSKY